ncbi:ROK family transcriptional regulator [Sediminispirochaeta smaragdinae]|uniref:ROK family protein n=1 Tax=Sediminispirochaeta smaragdinae (strain DSM 11293 / JCM 15392 / SEBR 4228) TaxID=573413 RepID=E1R4A5_SEDSS|nr:ROK family transcriptional regulator [Sediminispirochaeta smaragdinae]ADK80527.1 ROK family protein [Sediminispirochaeta smaragdinae DSM 11293]
MKIVGNSKYQKAANGSLILNYLRKQGGTSRSRIAEELGLQPSTVTYIMNRLLQAGLVRESSGIGGNGSGRKAIRIELNNDYGTVIGLDLQADYYNAVVTDIGGRVVGSFHREYDGEAKTFERRFASVLKEVRESVRGEGPVLGAGVAIPGVVDPSGPIIEECWTHNLQHHNLGPFLEENFSFPIVVENDANCCAWKNLWYEGSGDHDSFIYLLPRFHRSELLPENYPSVGIGMGLVYNGEIYQGFTHRAGEYRSLFFRQEEKVPGQLSLSLAEMRLVASDRTVRRKLVVELLGTLILIMHITNPRALFIGGDLAGEQDLVAGVLEGEFAPQWRRLSANGVRIEVLDDAAYDAATGAAAAMLNTLYAIPQVGNGEQNVRIWNSLLTNLIDQ